MKRDRWAMADVVWRLAVLAALCWIGWELHQIHQDMFDPVDEQPVEPDATKSL